MWVAPLAAAGAADDPRTCPNCGAYVRPVGPPTTAARYYRCESCKHLVVDRGR